MQNMEARAANLQACTRQGTGGGKKGIEQGLGLGAAMAQSKVLRSARTPPLLAKSNTLSRASMDPGGRTPEGGSFDDHACITPGGGCVSERPPQTSQELRDSRLSFKSIPTNPSIEKNTSRDSAMSNYRKGWMEVGGGARVPTNPSIEKNTSRDSNMSIHKRGWVEVGGGAAPEINAVAASFDGKTDVREVESMMVGKQLLRDMALKELRHRLREKNNLLEAHRSRIRMLEFELTKHGIPLPGDFPEAHVQTNLRERFVFCVRKRTFS